MGGKKRKKILITTTILSLQKEGKKGWRDLSYVTTRAISQGRVASPKKKGVSL